MNRLLCLAKKHNVNLIKLYLPLVPINKKFNKPLESDYIFNEYMINSAYSNNKGFICVFREEEALKTSIHEFIHFSGIDSFSKNFIYPKQLESKFDKTIDVNEAYTELIACVYNIIFTIIDKKESYDKFNEYYNNEVIFSLLQTSKILFLSNVKLEDFKNEIKQTTAAIGYYVLKCLMLLNLDKILQYFPFLGIPSNELPSVDLSLFINDDFIKLLKPCYEYLFKNKDKWEINELLYTGRMTISE
jgi:hypothetical protein